MDTITILCTVPVADAIKAGKNKAGRYDHELTGEQAAMLSHLGLAAIAAPYLRIKDTSVVQRLKVADATWAAVLAALEELRAPSSDARRQRQHELALLAEWGTKAEYERHLAGLTPEDELLTTARRVAFTRFNECVRYDKQARLSASDLRHDRTCALGWTRSRDDQERGLKYETVRAADLSAPAWENLAEIRRIVERANADAPITGGLGKYKMEPRRHEATCPECEARASRDTVMVTVTWCGRTLSREFMLRG